MLRCGNKTAAGEDCPSSFKRPGNLKRHILDIHQNRSSTFLNHKPGAQPRRTNSLIEKTSTPAFIDLTYAPPKPPLPALAPPIATPTLKPLMPLIPARNPQYTRTMSPSARQPLTSEEPATVQSPFLGSGDLLLPRPFLPATAFHDFFSKDDESMRNYGKRVRLSSETSRVVGAPSRSLMFSTDDDTVHLTPTLTISAQGKSDRHFQSRTSKTDPAAPISLAIENSAFDSDIDESVVDGHPIARVDLLGRSVALGSAEGYPEDVTGSVVETQDLHLSTRKRRRSSVEVGHFRQTRDALPRYEVKQSKKMPGQQRGLNWLMPSAMDHFRSVHDELLGRWGVTSEHKGTCVLCPEDWRFSDPLELMNLFNNQNCPSHDLPRAWYSHSDHATTLARAAAWFSSWPHTGSELDNFLGGGPWILMHGSHLCHHDHCIVHITYERGDTNEDRKFCRKRAKFLRQEGRDIPEHCTRHDPPCLMQVS